MCVWKQRHFSTFTKTEILNNSPTCFFCYYLLCRHSVILMCSFSPLNTYQIWRRNEINYFQTFAILLFSTFHISCSTAGGTGVICLMFTPFNSGDTSSLIMIRLHSKNELNFISKEVTVEARKRDLSPNVFFFKCWYLNTVGAFHKIHGHVGCMHKFMYFVMHIKWSLS